MYFRRSKSGVTKIVRDTYRKKPVAKLNGKKLTDDWYSLKARVLKRDGNRCRQCGVKHGSPDPNNPGKKIWLDAHHIKELWQGGMTVMSNLISLCRKCHNTRHRHHF